MRPEEDRVACPLLMGMRLDGRKEVIVIEDGHRASFGPWADLLRELRRRGGAAPVLAVGGGALAL